MKRLSIAILTLLESFSIWAPIKINNRSEITLVLSYVNAQTQQVLQETIEPLQKVILKDSLVVTSKQKLSIIAQSGYFHGDHDYISICNKSPMKLVSEARDKQNRQIKDKDMGPEILEPDSEYNSFSLKPFFYLKKDVTTKGRPIEYLEFSGGSITLSQCD